MERLTPSASSVGCIHPAVACHRGRNRAATDDAAAATEALLLPMATATATSAAFAPAPASATSFAAGAIRGATASFAAARTAAQLASDCGSPAREKGCAGRGGGGGGGGGGGDKVSAARCGRWYAGQGKGGRADQPAAGECCLYPKERRREEGVIPATSARLEEAAFGGVHVSEGPCLVTCTNAAGGAKARGLGGPEASLPEGHRLGNIQTLLFQGTVSSFTRA